VISDGPRWYEDAVLDRATSERLVNQAKLVFGCSLAMGLQIGIGHAVLVRSPTVVVTALIGSIVFGVATLALWQWVFPGLRSRPRFRAWQVLVTLAVMTVVSFVLVNAVMFVSDGRWIFSGYDGGDKIVTVSREWISAGPFIAFILPIIPTTLLCTISFNQGWWRIFLAERREHQARELAARAQLEALRAQINPHFLFNSLNSIAQLISSDPDRAEECVERLAEIFRYLLQSENRSFVTLEDELDIADAYLDIERARFGERLEVDFLVDEAVRHHIVPTLILQPLIENAVRHGVSQKVGGGKVSIEAQLDGGELQVVVRDTGVGMRAGIQAALSRGVGLRNVYDRLVQLYGESYAPRIDSTPGAGTTIIVRVPPSNDGASRRSEALH
jgi:signal transduction histidine kinase